MVGGKHTGKVARSAQLKPSFLNAQAPEFSSLPDQLQFQDALPKTVGALLFVGGALPQEGYMDALGGEDYESLPEIAIALAQPREDTPRTVIRTVFGATEEMPFRALSYLLPSLVLMAHLQEEGLSVPQFQIIHANHLSGGLNNMDEQVVSHQTKRFAGVTKDFVSSFFPTIKERIVFLEDTPLHKGSVLRDELITIARLMKDNTTDEMLEALSNKAQNHGEGRTHNFYGAAHLLIHDIVLPEIFTPLVPDQEEAEIPQAIISIGGKQEKFFYDLRHVVKPFLSQDYIFPKTLQFFSKHVVPPYYMARGGDISLTDVLQQQHLDTALVTPAASYDLRYLHDIARYRGDFDAFLAKQRKVFV